MLSSQTPCSTNTNSSKQLLLFVFGEHIPDDWCSATGVSGTPQWALNLSNLTIVSEVNPANADIKLGQRRRQSTNIMPALDRRYGRLVYYYYLDQRLVSLNYNIKIKGYNHYFVSFFAPLYSFL